MHLQLVHAHGAYRQAPAGGEFRQTQAADDAVSCEPPRLKLLVVEDNAADFALIERCLTRMPRYEPQIVLAGNLAAARFAAGADQLDAILVDHALGGEQGLDLVRNLGSAAGSSPCILLTSALTDEIEHEAIEAGAAACLGKDELTARLLETVLRQAVQGHEMSRALELPGRSDTREAGEGCVDVQSVVVGAVRNAREARIAHSSQHAIHIQLHDRPVWVRVDHDSLRRTLDEAFRAFGRRPLNVAAQSAGEVNEILVEPAHVSRAGTDQALTAANDLCACGLTEAEIGEPGVIVDLAPAGTAGPRLSLLLPSARKDA